MLSFLGIKSFPLLPKKGIIEVSRQLSSTLSKCIVPSCAVEKGGLQNCHNSSAPAFKDFTKSSSNLMASEKVCWFLCCNFDLFLNLL